MTRVGAKRVKLANERSLIDTWATSVERSDNDNEHILFDNNQYGE